MQLKQFRVTNYRNITDSGWVDVNEITAFVGQNEAGKSNLFEALYRINPFVAGEAYSIDEDWPVDDWGNKDATKTVCEARFALTHPEIADLFGAAALPTPAPAPLQQAQAAADSQSTTSEMEDVVGELPSELELIASRGYSSGPSFSIEDEHLKGLNSAKVDAWSKQHAPKFVLIQDYGLIGARIDLNRLVERIKSVAWHQLTNEEQNNQNCARLSEGQCR